MNFVAIDFETANEKRNSACSIGIVVVEDSKVIERKHILIKPKEMRFMPINIGIHGIRPSMVENEREFDEVWEEIKDYFNGSLVIAHNAAFDVSVLRNTLESYNIEMPFFYYICTMKLSRNFYYNLDNAKLNTVNKFLGFKFKHHDALADAEACANILLNICSELETYDINEVSKLTGVTIGNVNRTGYTPSSNKGKIYRRSTKESSYDERELRKRLNYESFNNEVVVFTGGLGTMARHEATRLVRNLGGTIGSSVTRKTTILITNVKDIESLRRSEMSTKLRKAMDLKEKGQEIKLLDEEGFLERAYID